jgi:hypothetical protein
MAIIENIASEIGDVIRIKTEVPVVGLLFLDTFTDSTEGESPTAYFNKEFRYSNDAGLNFTAWQQLNLLNIQDVVVEKRDQFVLEYRYEVVGSETDPELRFNSITVSGDFENLDYPIYDSTVFNQFFDVNDINVLNWAINVLEKLYRGGILPEYIKRGESVDNNAADKDFISYWNTITHFFALIVYFFRQFENITGQKQLLKSFLSNKDLALPTDDNLSELSYILYNYIDEYRKRGTERIIFKEGENGEGIDGEFLRLINWREHDEMLFALANNSETGWCLGESSPMWSGTEKIVNLTKAFEFTEDVQDLSKYPLIDESRTSIVYDSVIDKNVLKFPLGTGLGINVGIGVINPVSIDQLIRVGEGIDYEISFFIKKNLTNQPENLSFKVIGYTEGMQRVDSLTLDELEVNSFIDSNIDEILLNRDIYYYIRGVLFNYDKEYQSLKLNFRGGRPLKLQPTTKYIDVQIYFPSSITLDEEASMYIYDLKVKPLNLPMTQGLLGTKNIIFSYINNRGRFNNNILEKFVQDKLIPYNSWIKPYYWEDSGLLPSVRQNITFNVIDTGGNSVENVKITILDKDYFTNNIGTVVVLLYNGTYNFSASKDNFDVYSGSFQVNDSPLTINITLQEENLYTTGTLYNGYTLLEAESHNGFIQGMNIPTPSQTKELENYLIDNFPTIEDIEGTPYNNVGAYLKSTRKYPDPSPRWVSDSVDFGEDMFRFSALPSGYSDSIGRVSEIGYRFYFWAFENNFGYKQYIEENGHFRTYWPETTDALTEHFGYSLRLVRDLTANEINDFLDGDIIEVLSDYDGNKYEIVKIGNQGWTKQDIGTLHYLDGTSIKHYNISQYWGDYDAPALKNNNPT